MESTESINKPALERAWLATHTDGWIDWHTLQSVHRTTVYQGKAFVAWTLEDGQPKLLELYKVRDIRASCAEGVAVDFVCAQGANLAIGGKPQYLLQGKLIAWVPAFVDVRYAPPNYSSPSSYRRLTCTLNIRMRSLPRTTQSDGTVYFLEVKEFAKLWPEVAIEGLV